MTSIKRLLSAVILVCMVNASLAGPAQKVIAQQFVVPDGDVAALVDAITQANDEITHPGQDIIELTQDGHYVITQAQIAGGMITPFVRTDIIVEANNATFTIEPDIPQSPFLFSVAAPGNLTVSDLVTDGNLTAVYVPGSQATVNRSTFRNNLVYGRAVYVENGSTVTVNDSTFDNMSTIWEGASIYSIYSTVAVNNSTFTNNFHTPLYNGSGTLTLDGVTIENNPGSHAVRSYVGALTIRRSNIINNVSGTQYGGAVDAEGTALLVEDTFFSGNSNNASTEPQYFLDRGGAILASGGSIIVRRSRFENNLSVDGGAIFLEASLTQALIEDSTFTYNQAVHGGAITANSVPGATIIRSVFVGNSSNYGGALSFGAGISLVTNSVIENNVAHVSGGGILIDNPAYNPVQVSAHDNCFVHNTDTAVVNSYLLR